MLKKLVRSILFRAPRLYDLLTSQRRYRLYYALHLVHERDFRALPALLPPNALVLDIGGNTGQSVLSIKRVLPLARILSYEPNPGDFPALHAISRQFDDVVAFNFGLANVPGQGELFIPEYRGKVMSGLASFKRSEAEGWLSAETVFGFDPERLHIRRATVEWRTVDDLHLDPALIKVDVQGFEEEVIVGAEQTVKRSRPVLLLEAPSPRLHARLVDLGYERYVYRNGRLQAGAATNVFYLPRTEVRDNARD